MYSSTRILTTMAAVVGGLVLSIGISVPSASAEPNPCAGRSSDSGTGGNLGSWYNRQIYGTWYNCGASAGTDRVKIDVTNGYDGPCISVGYGSTGSVQFEPGSWLPQVPGNVPWYGGWKRC